MTGSWTDESNMHILNLQRCKRKQILYISKNAEKWVFGWKNRRWYRRERASERVQKVCALKDSDGTAGAGSRGPFARRGASRASRAADGPGASPTGFFRAYTFWTLSEARSRLYQRRFLRPRPHFAAFFKLYIFSFAPFQISVIFQAFAPFFSKFGDLSVDFRRKQ